ncbi:hypothetical protein JXA32_03210 [Candidatus Sumerlaeota bacterium]|nr:hypothetical protein [Candidatus Sumerlaeota bacterium]
MMNCKQAAELVSQALDRKLSLFQRIALWFHSRQCLLCRRYENQTNQLAMLVARYMEAVQSFDPPSEQRLSPEFKEQLRAQLQAALREEDAKTGDAQSTD